MDIMGILLSLVAFGSVALMTLVVARVFREQMVSRRQVALTDRRFKANGPAPKVRKLESAEELPLGTDPVSLYYAALHKWKGDDIKRRLLKAGYYTEKAVRTFKTIRLVAAAGLFVVVAGVLTFFGMAGDPTKMVPLGFVTAGLGYMLPSFALDKVVARRMKAMERMFPDFIDMLVVCVEAGMTLEAALNRIAIETSTTHPLFSIHLQIVMLEARAGKPVRVGLQSFADRTEISEARSLVSFVRQSEELGVSVASALRVYAAEMRQRRALSAEEQANALPTKMLLPIAIFLFPVTMAIVLGPVIITLQEFFKNGL